MKILIGKDEHIVVYIDYNNNLPHTVHTTSWITRKFPLKGYWRCHSWDFFPNNGDRKDIRFYNSGSGGGPNEIAAPQWCKETPGFYWLNPNYKLKGRVKNGLRLETPKRIKNYYGKSSTNPFKIGEETYSREYCEECGMEGTDYCKTHMKETDDGRLVYVSTGKEV